MDTTTVSFHRAKQSLMLAAGPHANHQDLGSRNRVTGAHQIGQHSGMCSHCGCVGCMLSRYGRSNTRCQDWHTVLLPAEGTQPPVMPAARGTWLQGRCHLRGAGDDNSVHLRGTLLYSTCSYHRGACGLHSCWPSPILALQFKPHVEQSVVTRCGGPAPLAAAGLSQLPEGSACSAPTQTSRPSICRARPASCFRAKRPWLEVGL